MHKNVWSTLAAVQTRPDQSRRGQIQAAQVGQCRQDRGQRQGGLMGQLAGGRGKVLQVQTPAQEAKADLDQVPTTGQELADHCVGNPVHLFLQVVSALEGVDPEGRQAVECAGRKGDERFAEEGVGGVNVLSVEGEGDLGVVFYKKAGGAYVLEAQCAPEERSVRRAPGMGDKSALSQVMKGEI
ncbi:hypothetical protein BGZ74_009730 [Mortierella antarctica]|nr:hypothetical protein BGZ74_009730 [Mortierella antarctica]